MTMATGGVWNIGEGDRQLQTTTNVTGVYTYQCLVLACGSETQNNMSQALMYIGRRRTPKSLSGLLSVGQQT